jgi:hypothetical protein
MKMSNQQSTMNHQTDLGGKTLRNGIEARELGEEELAHVSGGLKWDRNYTSSNVIDARGGQIVIWGIPVTLDVNGKVSSIGK